MFTATTRLWVTADASRLVGDGDPDAAFLFCIPGQQIPEAEAAKYGLTVTVTPEPESAPSEPEPAAKMTVAPENKMRTPEADKGDEAPRRGPGRPRKTEEA